MRAVLDRFGVAAWLLCIPCLALAEPFPISPVSSAAGGEMVSGTAQLKRVTPPPVAPCTLSQCDANVWCYPGTNSACLVEAFEETTWRVCIYATQFFAAPQDEGSKGLAIGPVFLRRSANEPFRRVIRRAGLAEIFTAYDSGYGPGGPENDSRHLYDTRYANFTNWRRPVTSADAGSDPASFILTLSQDSFPSVVVECRDRGPGWLCDGKKGLFVRRSHALTLWGIFDAGNYDYITEYGFQDDGTITMRLGATGWNNSGMPTEAHMHDALWRIEPDITAPFLNSALLTRHFEPSDPTGLKATELTVPFNGGVEGFENWDPEEFNTLLVQSVATNRWGNPMAYELEPLRTGTARHFGQPPGNKEQWTQHDFWVTRRTAFEDDWAVPWKFPDDYLLPQVNGQSINRQSLVLWYLASAHHEPTDEDRDSAGNFAVTLTHWFGFELRPHNFFDHNPLGGPAICD